VRWNERKVALLYDRFTTAIVDHMGVRWLRRGPHSETLIFSHQMWTRHYRVSATQSHASVLIGGPRTAAGPAGAPLTDSCRPCIHSPSRSVSAKASEFFERTSCSITMSKDSSATNRFSWAFSSCSCLNSRTCSDSSPAYRYFHR
jgi:hypothetical protein